MKRVLLILPALALALAAPVRAAEPTDDVKFYQMVKRTTAAAKQLDFTKMLVQIARRGANMNMGDGWFLPAESRYNWKWLSASYGGKKDRISPKDFTGPQELFARLDRNRDGFLTESDFDWSDSSAYVRQLNQAQVWLRGQSKDGKLTREQWEALFKQLAQGKDYLNADDIRTLLNPPAPPMPPRPQGPFDGMPSKALLLQGLFTNEIGSMFEGPRLGQRGPDFTLPTHDGKQTITLSNYWGIKPVVLIFGSFT